MQKVPGEMCGNAERGESRLDRGVVRVRHLLHERAKTGESEHFGIRVDARGALPGLIQRQRAPRHLHGTLAAVEIGRAPLRDFVDDKGSPHRTCLLLIEPVRDSEELLCGFGPPELRQQPGGRIGNALMASAPVHRVLDVARRNFSAADPPGVVSGVHEDRRVADAAHEIHGFRERRVAQPDERIHGHETLQRPERRNPPAGRFYRCVRIAHKQIFLNREKRGDGHDLDVLLYGLRRPECGGGPVRQRVDVKTVACVDEEPHPPGRGCEPGKLRLR